MLFQMVGTKITSCFWSSEKDRQESVMQYVCTGVQGAHQDSQLHSDLQFFLLPGGSAGRSSTRQTGNSECEDTAKGYTEPRASRKTNTEKTGVQRHTAALKSQEGESQCNAHVILANVSSGFYHRVTLNLR